MNHRLQQLQAIQKKGRQKDWQAVDAIMTQSGISTVLGESAVNTWVACTRKGVESSAVQDRRIKSWIKAHKPLIQDIKRQLRTFKKQHRNMIRQQSDLQHKMRQTHDKLLNALVPEGGLQQKFVVEKGRLLRQENTSTSWLGAKVPNFIGPVETCYLILQCGESAYVDTLYREIMRADPLRTCGYFAVLMPMLAQLHNTPHKHSLGQLLYKRIMRYHHSMTLPYQYEDFAIDEAHHGFRVLDAIVAQYAPADFQSMYFMTARFESFLDHANAMSEKARMTLLQRCYAVVTQMPSTEEILFDQLKQDHPEVKDDDTIWEMVKTHVKDSLEKGEPNAVAAWREQKTTALLGRLLTEKHQKQSTNKMRIQLLNLDGDGKLWALAEQGNFDSKDRKISEEISKAWMTYHIDEGHGQYIFAAFEKAWRQPQIKIREAALERLSTFYSVWLRDHDSKSTLHEDMLTEVDILIAFFDRLIIEAQQAGRTIEKI